MSPSEACLWTCFTYLFSAEKRNEERFKWQSKEKEDRSGEISRSQAMVWVCVSGVFWQEGGIWPGKGRPVTARRTLVFPPSHSLSPRRWGGLHSRTAVAKPEVLIAQLTTRWHHNPKVFWLLAHSCACAPGKISKKAEWLPGRDLILPSVCRIGFHYYYYFQYKEDQTVDKGTFIINKWKGKEKVREASQVGSVNWL